jgi:hypothetical protein
MNRRLMGHWNYKQIMNERTNSYISTVDMRLAYRIDSFSTVIDMTINVFQNILLDL